MPWIKLSNKEFKTRLIESHGEEIIADLKKHVAGKMTQRDIAKKYGFNHGYVGQLRYRLFPNSPSKKCKPHDNKEYLKDKLGGCNRGKIEGFKRYYAQNQYLFKDIFHADYSDQAAEQAFRKLGL